MALLSFIFGAACIGWLLPEFLFLFAPNASLIKSNPVAVNVICATGFAALAYGLRG